MNESMSKKHVDTQIYSNTLSSRYLHSLEETSNSSSLKVSVINPPVQPNYS